jgi:hypothetical protein
LFKAGELGMAFLGVLFVPLLALGLPARHVAAANGVFVRRADKSLSHEARLVIRNISYVKEVRDRKGMSGPRLQMYGKVAIKATGHIETQNSEDDASLVSQHHDIENAWYNGIGPDFLTTEQDPSMVGSIVEKGSTIEKLRQIHGGKRIDSFMDQLAEQKKSTEKQFGFFAVAAMIGVLVGYVSAVIIPQLLDGLKDSLASKTNDDAVFSNLLCTLEEEGANDWDSSHIAKLLHKSLATHAKFRTAARGSSLAELEALLRKHGARPEILADLTTWQSSLTQMQSELHERLSEILFVRDTYAEILLRQGLVRVVRLLRVRFKAHTLAGERFLVAAARGSSIPWSSDMAIVLEGRIRMDSIDIFDEARTLVYQKLGLSAEWQSQYLERDAAPDCKLEVQPGRSFACLQTCCMTHDVIMNVMCGSYKSADARLNVP